MAMSKKESDRQMLADAEKFLEENGLTNLVQEFLDSEQVKQIVHDAHEEQVKKVLEIKENAPAELKERGNKVYEIVTQENAEELFFKDAVANFKFRTWTDFAKISTAVLNTMKRTGTLENAFKSQKEKHVQSIIEICYGMSKKHVESFLEMMYCDYVPKGMPQEVADFMKMIGHGNALVPITAIFPDFGKDDETNGSEKNNAKGKKRKRKKKK